MSVSTRLAFGALTASALILPATSALAHRPVKPDGHYGPMLAAYNGASPITSGNWTPITPAFPGSTPGTALLLTDGTILMHDECTPNWYRLTPKNNGSYIGGVWRKAASMPAGYAPLYYASSVLPDGRVLVNGGEYNGAGCPSGSSTGLGELFEPEANKWAKVSPPSGWTKVVDAASVVLPSGQEMLQSVASGTMEAVATVAPYPATTVTWALTGAGKADANDEEGWTPLGTGEVLTVDTNKALGAHSTAELYNQSTGAWTATGTAPNILVDPNSHEIGPAVRRPDGTVFQTGANSCGAAGCVGHTAVYTPSSGTWTAGPNFPRISGQYYDVTDGPAATLPDGNVLIQTSPAYACNDSHGNPSPYCSPSHFFEYDGTSMVQVNEPSTAPVVAAYEGRMLLIPNGHVLWSSTFGGDVEEYTPMGTAVSTWRPVIVSVPATVTRGTLNYTMTGKRLHGVSNGAAYGDDAQMSSAYPIMRFTSQVDGHVCFAHVHDHTATSTEFNMPSTSPPVWTLPCTPGPATLEVFVNGIGSATKTVTIN
jgi:hypothetical protein